MSHNTLTTETNKLCWNCSEVGEENDLWNPYIPDNGMVVDCCSQCGSGWFDKRGYKLFRVNIGELYNEG